MTVAAPGTALAEWAAQFIRRDPLPEWSALAEAAVADTLACITAGAGAPETRALRRALPAGDAAGRAAILATAAHALDYDDNFGPALTHASAVLVPALLELAAEDGLDGAAVLRGWMAGLELQALIGRAVQPRHYEVGWHATATVGLLGAAGAAAAMIDGRARVIAAAMAIAASMAGGARQQFGTAMKPVHAGLAARNAVQAARLAQAGLEGADPFAGPWGFARLHAPGLSGSGLPEAPAPDARPAWVGGGVLAKRFACCGAMHRSLDGIELLRARLGPAATVTGIELRLPPLARANLRHDRPATPAEARFSAPFCAVEMLLTGQAGLGSFTAARLAAPEILAWLPRVSVIADESCTVDQHGGFTAVTTLRLADGRAETAAITEVRGGAALPFTAAERQAKLEDCCLWAGRPELAGVLARELAGFGPCRDLRRLADLTGAFGPFTENTNE